MPKKKESEADLASTTSAVKARRRTTKKPQSGAIDLETTKFSDFASQKTSKGAIFGSIHDAFFHYFMRQVWFAIEFLTVFAGQWAEWLDFKRLKIIANDYYDPKLKKYVADLVYEVPYKEEGLPPINISIIVEHKAQDDVRSKERTFINILRYILAETESHLETNAKGEFGSQKTPQALALLVYTGEDPNYKLPNSGKLFPLPGPLQKFGLNYEIPCVNLTQLYASGELDKIKGFPLLRAVCSIMALAGLRSLKKMHKSLFSALKGLKISERVVDLMEVSLQYVVKACCNVGIQFTKQDYVETIEVIKNQKERDRMLTIFEQERLDGKIEGEIEKMLKIIHQGLSRKYPNRPTTLDEQVDKIDNQEQLDAIFETIFFEEAPIEEIVQCVNNFTALQKSRVRRIAA